MGRAGARDLLRRLAELLGRDEAPPLATGPAAPAVAVIDESLGSAWGISGDGTTVVGFAWHTPARAYASAWTEAGGMTILGGRKTVVNLVLLTGLVGAYLITRWGIGLLRETSAVLLDRGPSPDTVQAIREAIEADADNEIADLHVWRLGPGHFAAIISVVAVSLKDPEHYKALLADHPELSHVTVEVNRCGEACATGN